MADGVTAAADAGTSDLESLLRERGLGAAILDTSDALVIVLDRVGRIVVFNQACERTSGWSAAEVRGELFWDRLLVPGESSQVRTVFESLRAGDFPNTFENHWLTRDGDRRLIAWSNTVLQDEDGHVDYVVGTGIDITAHAQMESELKRALGVLEQRTKELTELVNAAHAMQRVDRFEESARVIFDAAQRAIGAQSGYVALLSDDGTENEVLFLEAGEASCTVDPKLPMPIRGLRAEAYRTGEPVWDNDFASSDWMRYMPSGHAPLANVLFAPLVVEERVVGLMGLANKPEAFTADDARIAASFGEMAAMALRDSHVLEQLRSSERRFRSVADSAADAIVCVNSRGTVTYWNTAAEDIFGWSAEGILGRPVTWIMPERYRKPHADAMERFLATRRPRVIGGTIEIEGQRLDGTEFPIELSLATWDSREGTFFTAMIRDITERRKTESALARVYETEHRIAETLQTSLLPPTLEVDGLEIGAVYHPAHKSASVGGDFYDAYELDDGRVALMVGDIAGKGIDAAGLTLTVRSAVRTMAHVESSPAVILERVGDVLEDQLPSDQFATVLLAIIEKGTGELRLASAGHPSPLMVASESRWLEVEPGPPLGIMRCQYPETLATIEADSCLLMFTDGLLEARVGDEWFGEDGILSAACEIEHLAPQALADRMLEAAETFAPRGLQDDVAIVAVRLAD